MGLIFLYIAETWEEHCNEIRSLNNMDFDLVWGTHIGLCCWMHWAFKGHKLTMPLISCVEYISNPCAVYTIVELFYWTLTVINILTMYMVGKGKLDAHVSSIFPAFLFIVSCVILRTKNDWLFRY